MAARSIVCADLFQRYTSMLLLHQATNQKHFMFNRQFKKKKKEEEREKNALKI